MKEFIPYEQALELKELGFDEKCLAFYDGKGDSKVYYNSLRDGSGDYEPFKATERLRWFGAPLYQQAFRWFREKYEILHLIKYETGLYEYQFNYRANHYYGVYETYEEAELACLKKLIKIVERKPEAYT